MHAYPELVIEVSPELWAEKSFGLTLTLALSVQRLISFLSRL
jgi:hypothetical protein